MKTFVGVAVLGALALAAWSAVFTVDETQFAIVTRFGDPLRVIETPGLQFKWPAPIESVVHLDKRLMVLDWPGPGEPCREYLTQDKKNIEVAAYAAWRIADPLMYLKTLGVRAEAETSLGVIVASELGKTLGHHDFSALLSIDPATLQLEPIMADIRAACAATAAKQYGIAVVDFRIKRINFPEQNRNSVFQRMRAERKRIATRYRSEGEEQATKIRAAADQQRTEILADAYRQAQEIQGRADAEATRIYAEAYGQDPEFYEFLRTLESYAKSLTQRTTLVLPADAPYLNLLFKARTAPPAGSESAAQGGAVQKDAADTADERRRP
jgi:modulator of FtsH protease HflC